MKPVAFMGACEEPMKKRILVIEDERGLADMMKLRLESGGYEVCEAFDGEQGLQMTKTFLPDLIILDLVLPKLGGTEILDILKQDENFRHIPIIVATALSRGMEGAGLAADKADAFFQKPYDFIELMSVIADFLKESGQN